MEEKKILRINELAKKAKEQGLTEAEAKERAKAMRKAGHKVKIVPKDAPTYTEV